MDQAKTWVGRNKRITLTIWVGFSLLLASLAADIIARHRTSQGLWFQLAAIAILTTLVSNSRIRITTDAEKIEIARWPRKQAIRWDGIKDYVYDGSSLKIFGKPGAKTVAADLMFIQNKAELLALLDEKLGKDEEQFDCLQCGARIKRRDDACPKCGWSWRENGGTRA